jgi:uncharacterized protein with PIN domain
MRFIADAMLGKLARWLRLMGYDVDYSTDLKDDELLTRAKERTLLTRDRALYGRAKSNGLDAILISGGGIRGQLTQLKEEVGLELRDMPELARCPLCNGELEGVEKEKIKEKVPVGVSDFFKCVDCENVYWEGSHWKNIKETIKEVEGRGKDVQNPKR